MKITHAAFLAILASRAAAQSDDVKTPWLPPVKAPAPATAVLAPSNRPAPPIAKSAARAPAPRRDRVFFDEPGDGSLWARGADYKARFGADGLEFVPFLGSDAPSNFPVVFELVRASVDGTDFALEPAVISREKNRVAIDRGPVRTEFAVALEGVEQLFVLDDPPRGELVLQVAVNTELAPAQDPVGCSFSNDRGGVRYGLATALDASGRSAPAPVVLAGGSLEIRVPAEFVREATLPLVVDPLITTFTTGAGLYEEREPDIAFDLTTGRTVYVYEEVFSQADSDVRAVQIAGTFATIDVTGDSWRRPRIADNGAAGAFLVVCEVGPAGASEIRGRRLAASNLASSNQTVIAPMASFSLSRPDIGGDTTGATPHWLVVYERAYAAADRDVHAALVDAQLQAVATIVVDNSFADDHTPSVSLSNAGGAWNLAWSRVISSVDHDLHGARVTAAGTLAQPSFTIDASTRDHRLPDASAPLTDPDGYLERWMVVCQVSSPTGLDAAAFALDDATVLDYVGSLSSFFPGGDTELQHSVRVATDGCRFAVAWSESYQLNPNDHDIYLAQFDVLGTSIQYAGGLAQGLGLTFDNEISPAITAQNPASHRYALVWDRNAATDSIDGAIWETAATPTCIGAGLCSSFPNSTGQGALLRVWGSDVVAQNQLVLEAFRLPPNRAGYFLASPYVNSGILVGQGLLCIGPPSIRFVSSLQYSGAAGAVSMPVDLDNLPQGFSINPGETWHFQYWTRDVNPIETTNFSSAESVSFQ